MSQPFGRELPLAGDSFLEPIWQPPFCLQHCQNQASALIDDE